MGSDGRIGGFTADEVLDAIGAWVAGPGNGEPPRTVDWSPGYARHYGRADLAERFERDGCWPSVKTGVPPV
jgi:hypothetical protein